MKVTLETLSKQIHEMGGRFGSIDTQLTGINNHIISIDDQIISIHTRLTNIDTRLERVEKDVVTIKTDLNDLAMATANQFRLVFDEFDDFRADMNEFRTETNNHFDRIDFNLSNHERRILRLEDL